MQGALKQLYELDELAAIRTPLHVNLSVDELSRFVEALEIEQRPGCDVQCYLHPHRISDRQVDVNGTLNTVVQVQCQRCLEAMDLPLDIEFDWHMTRTDDCALKGAAQADPETRIENAGEVDVGNSPISLLAWIEDELLLALPLFAVHQETCDRVNMKHLAEDQETAIPDTSKPFADLKDLLSKNKT